MRCRARRSQRRRGLLGSACAAARKRRWGQRRRGFGCRGYHRGTPSSTMGWRPPGTTECEGGAEEKAGAVAWWRRGAPLAWAQRGCRCEEGGGTGERIRWGGRKNTSEWPGEGDPEDKAQALPCARRKIRQTGK
ncbi:hypothetical protein BS78_01G243700 [Paspalum vaginatum]|nr:hypothetical protein BS78_01G243700 [Paspalum vaginatum]